MKTAHPTRKPPATEPGATLLTVDKLAEHMRLPEPLLTSAVAALVSSGRVRETEQGGVRELSCELCVIPFDEASGWEAAVFDHYQAMVTAICIKLRRGRLSAALADSVGGSTYTFDIWNGHPMEAEVLGLLGALRTQARGLRERVEQYNSAHPQERPTEENPELRVLTYVGQGVLESEKEEGDGW